MTTVSLNSTIADWSRLGVLFATPASDQTPDLERLLLSTARLAPGDARLFVAAVSWVSQYGSFIARHRLKRLSGTELEPASQPALGLLLDLAIRHGAPPSLRIVTYRCGRADPPRPLFDIYAASQPRRSAAERSSCPEGVDRGLWCPDVEMKSDALRPAWWIIQQNPELIDRIVRKGDLRSTILETLRHDAPNHALDSERALVKLCAANRAAVTAALDDLEREGFRLRNNDANDRRRHQIRLTRPEARPITRAWAGRTR